MSDQASSHQPSAASPERESTVAHQRAATAAPATLPRPDLTRPFGEATSPGLQRRLEERFRRYYEVRRHWSPTNSRRRPAEGGDRSPTPGQGRQPTTSPEDNRRGRQRSRTSPSPSSPQEAPRTPPRLQRRVPSTVDTPPPPHRRLPFGQRFSALNVFLDDVLIASDQPTGLPNASTSTPIPAETGTQGGRATSASSTSLPGLITSQESLVGATAASPTREVPPPCQQSAEPGTNNTPQANTSPRHQLATGINAARRELRVLLLRSLLQVVEDSPTNNADVIWERFRALLLRTGQFRQGEAGGDFDIGAAWMFIFQEPPRAHIRSLAAGGERVIRNMMEGAERDE